MIEFERYQLDNGLTVILHQDMSTPLVAVNVLYKVGSKNESSDKTGFAHLFEHLMFGGSENIEDFDTPIQEAGGENNAFTNNDLTNFYDIVPAENIETALWLESDRMLKLKFDQNTLDIQKKVVIEEFKETSINKPYGDLWHNLSELAFQKHPYKWPTIGMKTEHIEDASLDDVKDFFRKHYHPGNAILVISGKFESNNAKVLVDKWFGSIPTVDRHDQVIEEEPVQEGFRQRTLSSNVPSTALYMAFHMPERLHKDFGVYDLISDILASGRSSRFYQRLIRKTNIFSSIDAYITGSMDPGLFIIEAKLQEEDQLDQARQLIWDELKLLCSEYVDSDELQKVKNSLISSICYSEVSILHKAINLAYFEMLGNSSLINSQEEEYKHIIADDLMRIAKELFRKENCSELVYLKNASKS